MPRSDDPVARMVHMGELYDLYGALLTARQREVFEMHYLQDLSLAEIAAQLGTSRQAAYDVLRRSELSLERYEAKVGLLAARQRRRTGANHVR